MAAAGNTSNGFVPGSGLAQIKSLALGQIFTRVITFLMNLYVARSVNPVIFGLQAIHLYLINAIVLFLAREAGRKASIRYAAPASVSSGDRGWFETLIVVNLSWLCILFSFALTVILTLWFHYTAPAEALPYGYVRCLYIYSAATMIEMLFEPLYVIAMRNLLITARLYIDSAATLIRCLVTVAAITVFDSGLMTFAYGQLAFSTFYTMAFYAYLLYMIRDSRRASEIGITSARQLFPRAIPASMTTMLAHSQSASPRASASKSPLAQLFSPLWSSLTATLSSLVKPVIALYIDWELFVLYCWMLIQMLEKLCLTEGEKAVMVSFNFSLEQQGVYGLVSNLGSLVARLLFQPIEEASGTEFSLLFASASATTSTSTSKYPANSTKSTIYDSAARYLGILLKFLCLISMLLLSFGPNYAYIFIDLFYGAKWSTTVAPSVLSWYCLYIGFMALNGLTEAFVTSVTTASQMMVYNALLLVFSLVYLLACWMLLPVGAVGLIAANCINMTCRIVYSTVYIYFFFRKASPSYLSRILNYASPRSVTLATFVCASLTTWFSFQSFVSVTASDSVSKESSATLVSKLMVFLPHILVGVGCLAGLGAVIWQCEEEFCREFLQIVWKRREQREKSPSITKGKGS